MTKKINKDVMEFVKKIEPQFAELIQQKIIEGRKNTEVLDTAQLTKDITDKMQEWFALIEKDEVGSQLEIEVLTSLSARIMLLWWVREKSMDRASMMNTEVIGDTGHQNIMVEQSYKGEWCDKVNRTCQEGYCSNCVQGE